MKSIPCELIRDLIPLYDDRALSEESMKLVREHLANCPECRHELRAMRTAYMENKKNQDTISCNSLGEFSALRRKIRSGRWITAGIFAAVCLGSLTKIIVDSVTRNKEETQ